LHGVWVGVKIRYTPHGIFSGATIWEIDAEVSQVSRQLIVHLAAYQSVQCPNYERGRVFGASRNKGRHFETFFYYTLQSHQLKIFFTKSQTKKISIHAPLEWTGWFVTKKDIEKPGQEGNTERKRKGKVFEEKNIYICYRY
jgi:hypothetical protein